MKKVFSPADVAGICHVSKPTVHHWIDTGKLKSIQLPNGYKKIEYDELSRFLEQANIKNPFEEEREKNNTILIVDDEEYMVEFLKSVAEETASENGCGDYRIETAHDGMDAALKIGVLKPDLVMLDVMMPGMDGFEVCSKIRDNPELDDVSIIIITGLYDETMQDNVKKYRLMKILQKPIDIDEIKTLITRAVFI
ncbi:MAG: response regulator [Fibrobacterota bacterium]